MTRVVLHARIPFAFDHAFEAGEVSVEQYALACHLAVECFKNANSNDGVALVRLASLADLFRRKPESIRRWLHELHPQWIECKVNPGERIWHVRLTGLHWSPDHHPSTQAPHREPLPVWRSTSTPSTNRNSTPSLASRKSEDSRPPHGEVERKYKRDETKNYNDNEPTREKPPALRGRRENSADEEGSNSTCDDRLLALIDEARAKRAERGES
jgi:hypothetical protein